MKINLYYVEGISRIDTPSFNTKTQIGTIRDQEEFFLTKRVKSIDTTFYPPHYQNIIKFDLEDLTINDNVNYLSLEYNDKTYYYFIDKINYTSTGIITLEVSMDTIQTYMFDIFIANGIIERKFINRWKNIGTEQNPEYIINRNYLRENVSQGIFQLVERKHFSKYGDVTDNDVGGNSNVQGIFVFECTDKIGDDDITGIWLHEERLAGLPYSTNNNIYTEPIQFVTYIVPVIPNVDYITLSDGTKSANCNYSILFNRLLGDPKVYNAFFIPNVTKDFFTKQVGGTYFSSVNGIKVVEYEGQGLFSIHKDFIDVPLVKTYTHQFERNHIGAQEFNSSYMPMMLDENYIRYEYGEGTQLSTVPLYYQCFSDIGLVYESTVLHGNRCYNIVLNYGIQATKLASIFDTDNYYIGTPDFFNTAVACNDKIRLTIMDDAYKQWLTYNKATIPMAYVSTIANCFTYGIMNSNNEYVHKTYTTSTSGRKINGMTANKQTHFNYSTTRTVSDEPHYAPTRSESLGNVATSMLNATFAPPSVRASGSYLDSMQNHALQICFNKHVVNDFERCAQYYHRNGYLINDYVTQISDIFTYVKNRYYFDVLKMSECEPHLHHVIEDEDTINQIKERFENGLRLWHVNSPLVVMGDFTYDNVEYDFLS